MADNEFEPNEFEPPSDDDLESSKEGDDVEYLHQKHSRKNKSFSLLRLILSTFTAGGLWIPRWWIFWKNINKYAHQIIIGYIVLIALLSCVAALRLQYTSTKIKVLWIVLIILFALVQVYFTYKKMQNIPTDKYTLYTYFSVDAIIEFLKNFVVIVPYLNSILKDRTKIQLF